MAEFCIHVGERQPAKVAPFPWSWVSGSLAICTQTLSHLQSPVPSLVLHPSDTSDTYILVTLKPWLGLASKQCDIRAQGGLIPVPFTTDHPDSWCQKGPKCHLIWVLHLLQLALPTPGGIQLCPSTLGEALHCLPLSQRLWGCHCLGLWGHFWSWHVVTTDMRSRVISLRIPKP